MVALEYGDEMWEDFSSALTVVSFLVQQAGVYYWRGIVCNSSTWRLQNGQYRSAQERVMQQIRF